MTFAAIRPVMLVFGLTLTDMTPLVEYDVQP